MSHATDLFSKKQMERLARADSGDVSTGSRFDGMPIVEVFDTLRNETNLENALQETRKIRDLRLWCLDLPQPTLTPFQRTHLFNLRNRIRRTSQPQDFVSRVKFLNPPLSEYNEYYLHLYASGYITYEEFRTECTVMLRGV